MSNYRFGKLDVTKEHSDNTIVFTYTSVSFVSNLFISFPGENQPISIFSDTDTLLNLKQLEIECVIHSKGILEQNGNLWIPLLLGSYQNDCFNESIKFTIKFEKPVDKSLVNVYGSSHFVENKLVKPVITRQYFVEKLFAGINKFKFTFENCYIIYIFGTYKKINNIMLLGNSEIIFDGTIEDLRMQQFARNHVTQSSIIYLTKDNCPQTFNSFEMFIDTDEEVNDIYITGLLRS